MSDNTNAGGKIIATTDRRTPYVVFVFYLFMSGFWLYGWGLIPFFSYNKNYFPLHTYILGLPITIASSGMYALLHRRYPRTADAILSVPMVNLVVFFYLVLR